MKNINKLYIIVFIIIAIFHHAEENAMPITD